MAERKAVFMNETKRMQGTQKQDDNTKKRQGLKALSEIMMLVQEQKLLMDAEHVTNVEEAIAKIAASPLGRDHRWRLAHEGDRRRVVAIAFADEQRHRREEAEKAARDFRLLLQETILDSKKGAAAGAEPPSFGEARSLLRHDERWKAVGSTEIRQRIFGEVADVANRKWLKKKREEAEEEDELLERRKRSRRSTAESEYLKILEEHIRCPLELSWQEVRVLLSNTKGAPDDLDEAGRESVFNKMRQEDLDRKLGVFSEALLKSSADEIGPELSFAQASELVMAKIGNEARVRGVPQTELKRSWEDWRRLRLEEAADAFRSLLRQSEYLAEAVDDQDAHSGKGIVFEALVEKLKTDKRYRRLDPVPTQRTRIILARLAEAAAERQAASSRAQTQGSDSEGEPGNPG
eukprot:TRINITY_DN95427_c0_g1_i1.p1 TRINITY_DN95427_c0_g1~~TRINITY_DN95427_c0_g1_i1.p1  ORF type:complete len:464 (-),score=116.99 TRINITY_DN95427_c0_g1_i1:71-1288(-)